MYGQEQADCCTKQALEIRRKSLRERLTDTKNDLQKEIGRISQLLELLDKNPAIEQFMDLSGNLGKYL